MEATTTVSRQPGGVQAEFRQDVSGNLIIGNHNVQINAQHGSIVNLIQKEERPHRIARRTPVRILPRRFNNMLDRRAEVDRSVKSLSAQRPLDIYAQSGMGKTSLLRFLSRHSLINAFADGVIYLRVAAQPVEDLLQSIYDAFYEYTAPYKPSQGEIRQGLQDKQALIVLDDVALEREEVETLMDAAPESNFLLASADRRLWGHGDLIALPGLPEAEGAALFARELGRSLEPGEHEKVRLLCLRLSGHPLRILQAANLVRGGRMAIEQVATGGTGEPAEQILNGQMLGALDIAEKKVTAAVAALQGAPLHRRHLPAMTGLENANGVVERLLQRGVVQAHSPKYTLAGDLGSAAEQAWDLNAWRRGALHHFSQWGESQRASPHLLAEENEAVQSLLEWGAGRRLWRGVLRLVYQFEGSLALTGRWGAWAWVLQRGMEAAQALGNQPARAWALHQLGTRALCLDQSSLARDYLIQALRLRESLGDWEGAAVTRHNLNLLLGGPPSSSNGGSNGPSDPPPTHPGGGLGPVMAKVAPIAFAVIAGAIALGAVVTSFAPIISEVTPTTVAMVTLVDTPRPTGTFTLTPSPSASATDKVPTATGTPAETTEAPAETQTERPATVTPSTTPCQPRLDWPEYRVQSGDTLWNISQRTSSSVQEIRVGNCLAGNAIYSGQFLYVPREPVDFESEQPTVSATPTGTNTSSPTPSATTTPTQTASPTPSITITPTYTPTPSATTPVPTEPPDLIADLDSGGAHFNDTSIQVPFYVGVSNVGGSAAGHFTTAVFFRLIGSDRPEESLAFETESLAPGDSLPIQGVYEIGREWEGYVLEIRAVADYCPIGLAPSACRVLESNEGNNQAGPMKLTLPRNQPPEPTINRPDKGAIYPVIGQDTFGYYAEVAVEGSAKDPEDGQLGDESLVWTSPSSYEQKTGRQSNLRVYHQAEDCRETWHTTITLKATDSRELSAQVEVEVSILGYCKGG
jgi:LysM repeat protein